MIVCSPDNPGMSGSVYRLPYSEAVEGKRHGYDNGTFAVQWTRNPFHTPDPRCPECKDMNR